MADTAQALSKTAFLRSSKPAVTIWRGGTADAILIVGTGASWSTRVARTPLNPFRDFNSVSGTKRRVLEAARKVLQELDWSCVDLPTQPRQPTSSWAT